MRKTNSRAGIRLLGAIGLLSGLAGASIVAAAPAGASPPGSIYVGQPRHGTNYSCNNAEYSTISAAVAAASPGATIIVCQGYYSEDVVITEPLTLIGRNAVVDPGAATNSPYYGAIGSNAFTILAPNVTVDGFTVTGASGDGILTGANYTTIDNDTAVDNGGTGIDINSSSWSTANNDTSNDNVGGGIYLTNDLGVPASHDTVTNNDTNNNLGGCGIILADHTGAGIFDNYIVSNDANGNGNDPAGSGAGVVLASEVAGGAVYDNYIADNTLDNNGLAGVTLHSHLAGQGNFSGNVITENDIGTNNVGGAGSVAAGDDGDPYTTGIYLGSIDPASITITYNVIRDDQIGIYVAGAVTVAGERSNPDRNVTTPVVTTPTYAG